MKCQLWLVALAINATAIAASAQWTAEEPFELKKTEYEFVIPCENPKEATVDIAVSAMLADRSGRRVHGRGGSEEPKTIRKSLANRDAGNIEFDAGYWTQPTYTTPSRFVETYPCGLRYEVKARGKAVVVELRPLFQLPSGDLRPWTIARGSRHMKQLNKFLARADQASAAIPRIEASLRNAQSQTSSQTGNFAAARAASVRLQQQLQVARNLASQRGAIQKEISATTALGEYSSEIARSSKLFVAARYRGRLLRMDDRLGPPARLPKGMKLREWTSADGKHRFLGEFVQTLDSGQRVLIKGEERSVIVEVLSLSDQDRDFIEQQSLLADRAD